MGRFCFFGALCVLRGENSATKNSPQRAQRTRRTEEFMSAAIKPTKSEPGAERGPDAGSPRGLLDANGHSRRTYVDGSQPGVRVPFREIDQSPTRSFDGRLEENPPVRVYDTSGPWGDPFVNGDVRDGLPALRREWILGRGDVEEYEGREAKPIDDGYLTLGGASQARQKE